jgi:hypothetical protein
MVMALIMAASFALRHVKPLYVLTAAIALELLQIGPFYSILDNATRYWVYFLVGLYGRKHIFTLAAWFKNHFLIGVMVVATFLAGESYFVLHNTWEKRGILLALSLLAIFAAIPFGLLLERFKIFDIFKRVGQMSLMFYLGYFPSMLLAAQFLKTRMSSHMPYALTLFVIGIIGALLLRAIATRFNLTWLYEKPKQLMF